MALRTAIPRGLKSFVVRDAVLAAKPVDDTELLTINFTLPAGFGYICNELHVNIETIRAIDWNAFGTFLLSSSSRANQGFDYRMLLDFAGPWSQNGTTLGGRSTDEVPANLSRVPIIPATSGAFSSLRFANLAATVAGVGNVNALVSFWEYDLEQLAWFSPHSALNVVNR